MASDMMNDKAKRTNNLSPKNVIQDIHCIVGCTGSYIALLEKNLYFFSSLTFSKKVMKLYSLSFLNLLPQKRSWAQLFLLQ